MKIITLFSDKNLIIIVFYCGLVHITDAIIDTRAQKVVSHTVALCRISVCTWPTL